MKQWITSITVALSLSVPALANEYQEQARKIAGLYKLGLQSVQDGEMDAARKAFTEILSIDPNHGHARYQLGQLKSNHSRFMMAQRKALFKKTLIEKVDFEDAALSEVLETLDHLTAKASGKKFTPNFIIQDPKGKLKNVRVTLNLNKVPLAAALKYSLEQAGASVRYDSHATVITPRATVKRR